MGDERSVVEVIAGQPTLEGAGVRLRRVFGFGGTDRFDPFLLLDNFGSKNPRDYLAGFPWHPHRGIETITYMLDGVVDHGDSLGNAGTIGAGDVQWMTAGSGIIHQEMPKPGASGEMWGFQLWANLPASQKMMEPRYRDLTRDRIPVVRLEGGVEIRVVAGRVEDVEGPMDDIVIQPEYLDVTVPAGQTFTHPIASGHTAFAYVFRGEVELGGTAVRHGHLARFGDGERVRASADATDARFLLVAGKPLGEPVAWRGPIVMNTPEELELAFREYREGTFIKSGASSKA